MTTTPLPRMPACKFKDMQYQRRYIGDVYTRDQMREYAQQARADLEAENARLREALEAMQRHVEELCTVYGVPLPQATFDKARNALERKP